MVKYGLIGYPLGHSFSKKFFSQKFEEKDSDEEYDLYPIKRLSEFTDLINRESNLSGLNVTIPYKELIIPYLDNISEDAKEIGAVNVIKITRNGSERPVLSGYNSDWIGFRQSIIPYLSSDIKSALIIGTGGAAKAVAYALKTLNISFKFVSRNPQSSKMISYKDLNKDFIKNINLIINATPLGMAPDIDKFPNIPYEGVGNSHICYDLIYNPDPTIFLKKCHDKGAKTISGLEMLYNQAEISYDIWTNK